MLQTLTNELTFVGDIRRDVTTFLTHYGHPKTIGHSAKVAAEARRIAIQFGVDKSQAEIAGWLHDISAIFPAEERTTIAHKLGIGVLPEEEAFPMIIHQKLSALVARDCFGIQDKAILNAVSCHTTLKANATTLDKVVFVADKIAWDQPGEPPYLAEILMALEQTLDEAAFVYLSYLWTRRQTLQVVHPWFVAAYQQLSTV